jgi:hypothetical protein
MSDQPINTFTLRGKLNGLCSIKLYPYNEFQQGRWNICVSQLIYHIKNDVKINDKIVLNYKEICGCSCNFVKTKQYSVKTNELETVFQNLNLFLIQGPKNEKRIINFERKWSLINNLSEELKLFVTNLSDSEIFDKIESDIYVIILLQRVV